MSMIGSNLNRLVANFHLRIFEDLMLYGIVTDDTLSGLAEDDKAAIRTTYETAYRDWDTSGYRYPM